MSQMLKLALVLPLKRRDYLRGKLDEKNLERMRAARDAGREWPFPPIQVRKLDKPRKVKGREYQYQIVDGEHRRFLAVEAKKSEVAADVVKLTPAQADVEALRINITHGAQVDYRKRGKWVKEKLVKVHRMKVDQIAKLLHLTKRSVYRMVKDAEGMNRPAKGARAAKGQRPESAAREAHADAATWTPESFFAALASLTKEARRHADAIQTFYRQHKDRVSPHVDPLLEILQ